MNIKNNNNSFLKLREQYPNFYYHSFDYKYHNDSFEVSFHFSLNKQYHFKPKHRIQRPKSINWANLTKESLDAFVFHLGMIELVSYWKAACSPKIIIEVFSLTSPQIQWWKKLYYQGLGEFFYLNNIETNATEFVQIESTSQKTAAFSNNTITNDFIMVPIGGGKDSVVSIEILKDLEKTIIPMVINPRGASINSIEKAGFTLEDSIICQRSIDPQLLKLNDLGFLNGHTPFSAMLAFLSILSAQLLGIKHIALSNESSANESSVAGSHVNHQYSKSFEFEDDFRHYYQTYLHKEIEYFSFLRPLSELQIACLFSQFHQHHFSFRSCNVGSKEDIWCGNCPKCLFTYILLSPFIAQEKMHKIFGKALLDDPSLAHTLEELRGKTAAKPFECVGTVSEVELSLRNAQKDYYKEILMKDIKSESHLGKIEDALKEWNSEHYLSEEFEQLLQKALLKC